jgi:YidC/Oxa1 family membrane protein insertase
MFLSDIWNTVLYVPILNLLIALYHFLFSNLGLAIIALTLLIKVVTYPLSKPMLEMSKKQKELQPQLDELKKKYTKKEELAQKQMELYKEHGVNPAAGCLPQIIQLIIVIALYRVFTNLLRANGVMVADFNHLLYNFDFLKFPDGAQLNTQFLFWNLAKPDPFYILPVVAAIAQFIMSKYTMKSTKKMEKLAEKTPDKSDDVMYNMQEQMTYMAPIMTLIIGVNLPSGLVFYWFTSTVIALGQYVLVNRKKAVKPLILDGQKSN